VVGDGSLDSANSKLLGGQFITTEFLGAPLGTALFVLSRPLPFVIDAVSFVVSTVLVASIKAPRSSQPATSTPMTPRVLVSETVAGVRWLWHNRLLRTVCLMVGLLNFAVLAVLGIAVLYAVQILHISRAMYGLLLLIIAVGGLVGLLAAPKLVEKLGRGRTIQLLLALCPLSFLVGGFTSNPILAAAAFAFVGASISLANVVTTTLRQALIPAELFGRVNGAYRFVVNGMSPLGGLVGGLVAGGLGLRAPFFLAAAVFVVAIAAALPLLSNRVVDPLVAAHEAKEKVEVHG
jgi:predicted MFS family arabinose efflux permease